VRTPLALLLAFLPCPVPAQYTLYACMAVTKEYVVGARLPPSGLFRKASGEAWQHAGFNHPFLSALDYDPQDPSTIYLAAGNGLIRAADHGRNWTILTGSEVTELRDVAVDRNAPGTIYFAHSHGIRVSHDNGSTWSEIGGTLHRKFTESIRVDRRAAGHLLAGGEEGIFRSEDGGKSWIFAGAAGFRVLHIEQSPHDACFWLATTQGGGLFASMDCGRTFESLGSVGVGRNLYDAAFDPAHADRIAVAGWGTGAAMSEDRGKTWQSRNSGLPRADVWSIAFDPAKTGRLYVSVHEEAIYVSEDNGRTWARDGPEGSVAFRMRFVPEARPQ
jgi:photosystem II stability/assembly factor-like uncharacterized protein